MKEMNYKEKPLMTFAELTRKTRSFRRFDETAPITLPVMKELVDLARICPSTANRQPLKYRILSSDADRTRIFPHLHWAAYLKDWNGPEEGERPSGYILILLDKSISKEAGIDVGIAAQTIMAGAAELGLWRLYVRGN